MAALLSIVATASLVGQIDANGEIAGVITHEAAVLPGVRVVISGDDGRLEVITDRDGRFIVRMLKFGTYRVDAELAGFVRTSGTITLSTEVRRAQIAWPLEVGCMTQHSRVVFNARDASKLVATIGYFRVTSDNGSISWSTRPDCAGESRQSYSIASIGAGVNRSGKDGGQTPSEIHQWVRAVPLKPGEEYVGLFWPEWLAADGLVLPVVAGRIAAPSEKELNGLPVEDALVMLDRWSREGRR
jgi:hypothetical protein